MKILGILFIYLSLAIPAMGNHALPADTTQVKVAGVCGSCKNRIEKTSQGPGLEKASWDVETKILTLVYDPAVFDPEKAVDRILAAGHDVEDRQADQKAYHALPACCLYKDENNPHLHQNSLEEKRVFGVVMQENKQGHLTPIENANITWLENSRLKAVSDKEGVFEIFYDSEVSHLIVSFAGMQSDTIEVRDPSEMIVVTAKDQRLAEVVVTARRGSNFISSLTPNRLEILTSQELFKAACCDLSESFETNASVDVVHSDAVSGSKQIQMLGLSGNYTQLTVENLPGPRGLATPLGLNSISGSWIESIQISKGIGSVANGFENMTGQINVELKKPETAEPLFFNIYANNMGRSDINLNLAHRFSERWSGSVLLHDNFMYNSHVNFSNNGFLDIPVGNVFSAVNRWKYESGDGFIAQFGLKVLKDNRRGGELGFDPATDKGTTNKYGLGFEISRYELFAKLGYIFPSHRHRSLGLQLAASYFDQDSYYGLRDYMADQTGSYANLIFQDIIGTTMHKYRIGLSTQFDNYNEHYISQNFQRTEVVPGAFAEYTFSPSAQFDAVAGMRLDYNNLYGWFGTPRLHLRYQPVYGTTLRISAGRGQRTANIFAENTAALASSRMLRIQASNHPAGAYGLGPEVTWNTGISVDQEIQLFGRAAYLSAEFHRNDFIDQVIADFENPRELKIYNLGDGKSFANSFQTELRLMPVPHLEFRTAYRLFDVQTTFGGELKERPLVAKHRGFLNLGYHIPGPEWRFDYTLNVTGQKRLPSTAENPAKYQMPDYSKGFVTMNAQLSKDFGKVRPITIYLGAENLTNYYQKNPILGADQPFGQYFDTSMLWAPLSGRMFYAGMRLSVF